MRQSPIWYNAEAPIVRPNELIESARICSPRLAVIVNDPDRARTVRDTSPGTVVVSRLFMPGDARLDDDQHKRVTARQWLDWYLARAERGITLYCNNEPAGYEDLGALDAWTAEILDEAGRRGVSVCALNFGTGHPQEGRWHELRKTLHALERWHTLHYLGLHEYGVKSMLAPGRVGRFRELLTYCRQTGIRPPRILITEYGLDSDGGALSGWRSRGVTEEQYADMLISAWKLVYAPHTEVIGAAVFVWSGNERWSAFRVDDAGALQRRLEAYQVEMSESWEKRRIVLAGTWCNLREGPTTNAPATRFEANGTVVEYVPGRDVPDADKPELRWQLVRIGDKVGWVRSDAATLSILEPPAPPVVPAPGGVYVQLPELLVKSDEALRYAEALEGMARAIRAQVGTVK